MRAKCGTSRIAVTRGVPRRTVLLSSSQASTPSSSTGKHFVQNIQPRRTTRNIIRRTVRRGSDRDSEKESDGAEDGSKNDSETDLQHDSENGWDGGHLCMTRSAWIATRPLATCADTRKHARTHAKTLTHARTHKLSRARARARRAASGYHGPRPRATMAEQGRGLQRGHTASCAPGHQCSRALPARDSAKWPPRECSCDQSGFAG